MTRKYLYIGLMLTLQVALYACKDPSKEPTPEKKKETPRTLTLSLNSPSMQLLASGEGSTSSFDILNGNGGYQLTLAPDGIIKAHIEGETHVVVSAIKPGVAQLKIMDAKEQTKEVTVTVLASKKDENTHTLKLSLNPSSMQLLPLGEGSTDSFDILDGNGGYQLTLAPDGIIKAHIERETHVVVSAIKPGDAQLKITDAKEQTKEVTVTVLDYTPLTLELTTLTIDMDRDASSTTVGIQGNGQYEVSLPESAKKYVTATISEDHTKLLIKVSGDKVKTQITVTDNYTQESKTMDLIVKPKSIQKLGGLALPIAYQSIWEKETVESMKSIIEDTIRDSDKWFNKVLELPEYPTDRYHYKNQKRSFDEGKKIYKDKKKYYQELNTNLSAYDFWCLYTDLYQYGTGYCYIEYMARQSELFRLKYPDNKQIEHFIESTFDGNYSTQEGNNFFEGLNRDFVTEYNKIVDLFNRLEREP